MNKRTKAKIQKVYVGQQMGNYALHKMWPPFLPFWSYCVDEFIQPV